MHSLNLLLLARMSHLVLSWFSFYLRTESMHCYLEIIKLWNSQETELNKSIIWYAIYYQYLQDLRVMPSVSLSKSAVFLRRMEILGLMALGFLSSMFSSLILSMTAYPFLERIWANLKTREMHSPIPSICTLPCFLMMSLERKRPWFSLLALRTLYTLVSLNFDCCYMWWKNQRINISTLNLFHYPITSKYASTSYILLVRGYLVAQN